MASTFTDLGIEKMATGENAGTWGDKTNTNLEIVEKAIAGYVEQAVTSGGTTQLTITDGDSTESTSVARHAVIKLTGTISGNSIVTVPDSIEKVYIVTNGTSGAYTVQFKTASGTGITFGVSEKTTRLVYSDGTNIVDAGFSGASDMEGRELILDADGDTSLTADTDDQIDIKIAGADDFRFTANTFTALSGSSIVAPTITASTAFVPDASDGAALGTSSLEFSDLFLADAAVINLGADQDVTLTHVADTGVLLNSASVIQFRDSGLTIGSNADGDLDIVSDGTAVDSINIESAGGITLDAGTAGSGIIYEDDGTEMARVHNSSSNVILETKVSDADFSIKGNDGGSTITALAFDMSDTGKATFSGDVVVTGDLTVSGDDITMGTNTAGNLLIADGTNFNSIAATSLSEISTIASDDVFLAVDTSGGGLKKVARSVVVSGLATSAALTNIVEDTTPQLGGNLDTNSANILIDDAHFIADENGNEQIIFQTTSSAVNQFDVTNAATGNPPSIKATGGDSNIDFNISAKGTGHVTVLGDTNSGAIQFNCESNSHGQIVIAQPHSAAVTNTLTLPAGASSTLVSLVSEDTLTNKTLTSPKINENVAITSTATELNKMDGDTSATSTTVADADRVVMNDNGTMVQVAVTDLAAYFDDEITSMPNLTTAAGLVTVSALNAGSITSGFGTINTGSSAITTTGLISGGSLDIDNVLINGTTIGHTDDTDLMTVADGLLTVAGEVQMTTLDIGGTNVTSTAAELNKLDGVGTLKQAGKETIWVPAQAMTPTSSNGCATLATVETTSGRPDMNVLDFDKDSDEFAQFAVAFPKSWNAGTVTFQFFWSGIAATTSVTLTLAGVAFADNDSIDTAYGTAVAVADNAQGAVEECLVSAESGNITIAGSPGDNELTYFRIGRDVSEDDMAGDCRLHGIKLHFTTDLANDA